MDFLRWRQNGENTHPFWVTGQLQVDVRVHQPSPQKRRKIGAGGMRIWGEKRSFMICLRLTGERSESVKLFFFLNSTGCELQIFNVKFAGLEMLQGRKSQLSCKRRGT